MPLLKEIIPSLLSPNPQDECVRDFVHLCQRMAASYLRVKMTRGRLNPNIFSVGLDDLALDCIADLFERDERNCFVEIVHYYRNTDFTVSTQEELMGATRRLVFSKVNEGLFRLYKENDRSLSNTIRNLKNALRSSKWLLTINRNHELWVTLSGRTPANNGMPLMPPELVETQLLAESGHWQNLPALLETFVAILRDQELYSRQYPLPGLALIVRSVLQRSSTGAEQLEPDTTQLSAEEVRSFLKASIVRAKSAMHPGYVGKSKMDQRTFDLYFDCIGDILEAEYVENDGRDLTYLDILRNRMGIMSEANYKKVHRVHLEYLAKLTRKNFLESVKKELISAL